VTQIFTSAYEDNLRSIHALTKLGFSKLAVRAQAPDEMLEFFHLGLGERRDADAAVLREALVELCRAIESPLEVL